MTLRQQIVQDHIEKTATSLGLTADKAFQIFAHSLFTDNSLHLFDENDNVDGGQDKQIDTITIDDSSDEATVYITQVKNEDTFSSNCIIQIRNGLEWIFEKKLSDVDTLTNLKFKDRIKDYRNLQSTLGPSNIKIKVAYITKGLKSEFSAEAIQERKTILDKYDNGIFEKFSFEIIGAEEIVDILNSQEKKNKKIDAEIKIVYDTNNPSLIRYHSKGLKGIICSATASEIAQIVSNDPNGFVFDLNIRKYLGNLGGVNKDIINTCSDSNISHLFWFLNNGVTIICDKVDPITDPDDPKVKIENMQIVNGCQTATSIANALREGHLQPDTKLLLRIYETKDLDLVDKIVLTTNNQNKITGRNLRANDITQLDLEKGFSMFDYFLERKPRQFENKTIDKDKIIPNEDVAVSYLALILKKPSDARSRKYKVWNEYYDKVFSGTDIIEPYLLSVLIHRKVYLHLLTYFANSTDDTTRYIAKNASFHISRITAFLWRGNDNWTNTATLKQNIASLTSENSILENHINNSVPILTDILKKSKFANDLNNALKSSDIDNEMNKELHTNHNPAVTTTTTADKN